MTGGRSGDAKLGELASLIDAVQTARERAKGGSAEDEVRLARHALEISLPDASALVLVQTPATPVGSRIIRGTGKLERNPCDDCVSVDGPFHYASNAVTKKFACVFDDPAIFHRPARAR
ncbi:MAG: hypothetical protein U0165_17570 [Polyangiaceae bacterium]